MGSCISSPRWTGQKWWPELVLLSLTTSISRCCSSGVHRDLGLSVWRYSWRLLQPGAPVHIRALEYSCKAFGNVQRLTIHRQAVSSFHKGTLRDSLRDSSWVDRLPWVMLGPAPQGGPASFICRVGLWPSVAGPQGFHSYPVCCVESAGHTRVLMPVPTSQHGLLQTHIPNNLQLAGYVFIWKDANWASLPWRQGKDLHSGYEWIEFWGMCSGLYMQWTIDIWWQFTKTLTTIGLKVRGTMLIFFFVLNSHRDVQPKRKSDLLCLFQWLPQLHIYYTDITLVV